MKASISKSEIKGRVTAPSSKSYTIRAVMCAALACGESEIRRPLSSDDTEAALKVLSQIGVHSYRTNPPEADWFVTGGTFRQPELDLFCSDSAATLRFMTAICTLVPGRCRLVPGTSLSRRPAGPLLEALKQLGVSCSQDKTGAVTVVGGKLKGGTTELPGNVSSQYVSALLLISPLAESGMNMRLTTPLESQPYVLMTIDCLKRFGIKVTYSPDLRQFNTSPQTYASARYNVEGDWSSASYLLALGALSGEIQVRNLNPKSLQGDRLILDLLRDMGAAIQIAGNSVTVKKSSLTGICADLSDSIDLLPTLAVLAAGARGVSQFDGIARARLKESNRVTAVSEGLSRMGIAVTEKENRLNIIGGIPKGALIDSQGDHRIAMAFGILGTAVGNTVIKSAECVTKTYPEFWDVLKKVGGKVTINGQ